MARQKVVNGVYIDLTESEEAELDAQREAADLDMNHVRGQRDGQLRGSDWTQIGDAALRFKSISVIAAGVACHNRALRLRIQSEFDVEAFSAAASTMHCLKLAVLE